MDKFISPQTGDYTGARCRSLENAVYLRLKTPLGHYWADKAIGSRLHELEREKDLARVHMLARQYAEQALMPLKQDGRAKSIVITVHRIRRGWVFLLIAIEDAKGESHSFKHPVRIA
ncbi:MAG: phage GP46 family protein [Plesiomonas sp.]|uniref:phage GP46 family protein n=1 Tax=Plesiomonas sp. TaxID=2486279 RepID=UPI003F348E26